MRTQRRTRWTRRRVLEGLAVLPVVGSAAAAADDASPSRAFLRAPPPLSSADQVVNVMDFEPLARDALPPAHFGYVATGADDDRTVARNHEAFSQYQIRARRFNDLTHLDTSLTLLGSPLSSPIYLSAVSAMRAFHPEGELAVARAARAKPTQLMLSTGTSMPLEAVIEARGAPLWQQLYPTNDWTVTAGIVHHAEQAGCTAIALTVDSRGARNNETLKRAMRIDARECVACHPGNSHDMWRRGALFAGLDVSRVNALAPPDQSRAFLDKVRSLVKSRLIIKGIVTAEDAAIAIEAGADAIVVSNHGGRNEDTLRATIDCLPEIVATVHGRIPVLLDGGVRRGTDVFKALALGARAVGIGRPQVWGLAAFGQPGVESVLEILNRELLAIMRQAGTASLGAITPQYLVRSA